MSIFSLSTVIFRGLCVVKQYFCPQVARMCCLMFCVTIPGSTTETEDHKAAQFLVYRCTESKLPLGKDSAAFGNSVRRRFKSKICSVSNGRNV